LYFKQTQFGLVKSSKATVYSGPSETQNVLFYVHRGAEFKVLRSGNWHLIQFSNGLKGWIKGIDILEI